MSTSRHPVLILSLFLAVVACAADDEPASPDAAGEQLGQQSSALEATADASAELGAAWGNYGPGYDTWVKSVLQFAGTTGYSFKALPHSGYLGAPSDTNMTVVVFRDGAGRPRHAAWYVRSWAQRGAPTAMGIRPFEALQIWGTNGGPQIVMTSAADVAWWDTYLKWVMEDFSGRIQTAGFTGRRPEGCMDSSGLYCFVGVSEQTSATERYSLNVNVPWPFEANADIGYSYTYSIQGTPGGGWLDIVGRVFTGVVFSAVGSAIGELIFVGSEIAATTFGATFGAFTSSLVHGADLKTALLDGLVAGSFTYVGASLVDAFGDPTALVGVHGAGCPSGDRCWYLQLLNGFPPTKALAELHDPFIDWSTKAFAQGGTGWFKAISIPPFAVPGCASSPSCVTAGLIIATESEVSGPRTLPAPLPTCSASLSPGSGTTATAFGATWSSDATSCSWKNDGISQGAVACAGSAGGLVYATTGNHKITLVATGPGGTRSCDSNTVAVSAPLPLPTCSASLSPGSGTTATAFGATWSSNGTTCSWKNDGVNQGAVACSGSAGGLVYATTGNHKITLVATGPGGTRSCDSNTVAVSAPLPTCSASLSPTSGTTATAFGATWTSNATSCSWKKDGVSQGAVACSGSAGGLLYSTTGSHKITLVVTGPGGTRSCDSNTVSVSAPLPTCSASLSPTSGTRSTAFGVTWSSNGTSCSWKKDGVSQGAVACTGSAGGLVYSTTGSHKITLVATGPGGTRSCDSNTISVSP